MAQMDVLATAMTLTIGNMAARLRDGDTTSTALIDQAFNRINDSHGQGQLAFVGTFESDARRRAADIDALRKSGLPLPRLAGIPVSVKDLFDIAGDVTCAGSRVLSTAAPARCDATIVARLRAAGAIIVGRTNMTEFAYSGLGLNPHYGTPANPYERSIGRIPGGSSSGAAVSVTDGMCVAAIGTDTGGSVRIPAALTGIVGFKPSRHRVALEGTYPLSPSLDTIGPIANSVACCAALDSILADEQETALRALLPRELRIGVIRDFVFDDVSDYVADCFDGALSALATAGAHVRDVQDSKFLCDLPQINAKGGFAAAEAFHNLHALIELAPDAFDPRVSQRVLFGGKQSADDYLALQDHRRCMIAAIDEVTWRFDAVVCPTVPCIAPKFSDLDADPDYFAMNALMLRNPSVANFLDRPAITIPCHDRDAAPVGFMMMGERGADRGLLNVAQAVESVISPRRPALTAAFENEHDN